MLTKAEDHTSSELGCFPPIIHPGKQISSTQDFPRKMHTSSFFSFFCKENLDSRETVFADTQTTPSPLTVLSCRSTLLG